MEVLFYSPCTSDFIYCCLLPCLNSCLLRIRRKGEIRCAQEEKTSVRKKLGTEPEERFVKPGCRSNPELVRRKQGRLNRKRTKLWSNLKKVLAKTVRSPPAKISSHQNPLSPRTYCLQHYTCPGVWPHSVIGWKSLREVQPHQR